MTSETITERVRERYASAARGVRSGDGCCDSGCCSPAGEADAVTGNLYSTVETAGLPEEAVLASLGCGNPTALIELRAGETVLDLGSGGGIDVLLSAKRVGPTGFVYGVDMTDEMLALAQENKAKAGATNVAFLKGRIEDVPLPAGSVDVVISNCVINLSADKSLVLRDAFRVLKPGGRFAVADVVADGPIPDALRENMEAWVGCLAGALEVDTYRAMLADAGFADIDIELTRRYTVEEAGLDVGSLPEEWEKGDGKLASAFIRAVKPSVLPTIHDELSVAGACCDSGCCGGATPAGQQSTEAAPVACSLSGDELEARGRDIDALFERALIDRATTSDGMRMRFRRSPGVEEEIADFVRRERECCAFIDFQTHPHEGEIWVDLNVAPDAREVLYSLFAP